MSAMIEQLRAARDAAEDRLARASAALKDAQAELNAARKAANEADRVLLRAELMEARKP